MQGTHAKGTVPGPHACTFTLTACGQWTPTARPKDGQPGEDERLTSDTPHNRTRNPPRGSPPTTPTACNAGWQERKLSDRFQVATPTPAAPGKHGQQRAAARPQGGRPGEGERLTPDAPHNRERSPPGATSRGPRGAQHPAGHTRQGDSAGPPRPHTRAHSMWAADPDCPPEGGAVGGGQAPNLRRPSQRLEANPPGTPSHNFHSTQRQLARAHAVEPVLGPHAHTTRAWETQATGPGRPPPARVARKGRAPDTRRYSRQ